MLESLLKKGYVGSENCDDKTYRNMCEYVYSIFMQGFYKGIASKDLRAAGSKGFHGL